MIHEQLFKAQERIKELEQTIDEVKQAYQSKSFTDLFATLRDLTGKDIEVINERATVIKEGLLIELTLLGIN